VDAAVYDSMLRATSNFRADRGMALHSSRASPR
jgi:hypothetical protein